MIRWLSRTYGGEGGFGEPPRGRQQSPVRELQSNEARSMLRQLGRRGGGQEKNPQLNCDDEHCLAEAARTKIEAKATDRNFIVGSE